MTKFARTRRFFRYLFFFLAVLIAHFVVSLLLRNILRQQLPGTVKGTPSPVTNAAVICWEFPCDVIRFGDFFPGYGDWMQVAQSGSVNFDHGLMGDLDDGEVKGYLANAVIWSWTAVLLALFRRLFR